MFKARFKLIFFLMLSSISAAMADSQSLLELDASLVEAETKFHDLVPGAEKTIRWFNDEKRKTKQVIVYVHGFSASRQELSPTTELLADRLGANAYYLRLTGHGRSDDAMAEGSVETWQQDMLQALAAAEQLGEQIVITSASTGGTLATWALSEGHSKNVVANIMISPNFGVKSRAARILNWPFGLTVAKWINGDYNSFIPQSEKHGLYWTERYPLEAAVPMLDLVDLVEDMDKSKVSVPQFFVYSPDDKVVDVENIEATAREFKSANVSLHQFTTSTDAYQHVLSGDACSPDSTTAKVNLLYTYIVSGFSLPSST